jgi:transcription elongation factor GreA
MAASNAIPHDTMADLSLRRKVGFTYNAVEYQRRRNRIYTMSSPIVQKLQDEINVLEHELNSELPKELKRARALGDLSENAEYHMAKQRQEFVSARLMQLKNRLADLSLINMKNIPKDRIAFGSKVTLYDVDRDVEIEYRLVTSEEADVGKGLISTTSPIGRGLMGKKPGDAITVTTPNGSRDFEIRTVLTLYDQA